MMFVKLVNIILVFSFFLLGAYTQSPTNDCIWLGRAPRCGYGCGPHQDDKCPSQYPLFHDARGYSSSPGFGHACITGCKIQCCTELSSQEHKCGILFDDKMDKRTNYDVAGKCK